MNGHVPSITDVGIGGAIAYFLVKEVLTFLSRRKNGSGSIIPEEPLSKMDTGDLEKYVCRAQPLPPCAFEQNRDEIRDLLREIAANTRH